MRAAVLLILCACSRALPVAPRVAEADLRARLGIPPGASRVVIFAQTSHLDIDWQMTFPDYYAAYVENVFLEARQQLLAQPRAFYGIAEMAYLQKHALTHPEELDALRGLAASGALRIVGGGRTSPDTLLPETEMLLRDFLYGARFSEDTIGARPRAAWLPDSFGHAATVPDLLSAAGYESVMLGRIDGAPTLYEEIQGHHAFKPGSSAALLQSLGSADFLWRGPGGGRVLAHWEPAGIYCTGDDIDYDEPFQVAGGHLGPFHGNEPGFTDRKIEGYLAALTPYARTPYLFVPVGCDFQHPKPRLLEYLDGYNQRHGGAFAVTATFEDYAQLVTAHSDALPELKADLTPYFTGFLGSRPAIKRGARDALRPFLTAEPFAVALGDAGRAILAQAAPALEELTLSDHHDFITGTSTDAVARDEQLPLLQRAQDAGEAALQQIAQALSARIPAAPGAVARVLALNPSSATVDAVGDVDIDLPGGGSVRPATCSGCILGTSVELLSQTGGSARLRVFAPKLQPFSWRAIDLVAGDAPAGPQVVVQFFGADGQTAEAGHAVRAVIFNQRARAELSPAGLTSLRIDGAEALSETSFTVREFQDQGGLWRMGHEMAGCATTESAVPQTGSFELREASKFAARVALRTGDAVREVAIEAGGAGVSLALETAARAATTRTASFALAGAGPLTTSLAGGFTQHAGDTLYAPTYWPAVSWAAAGGWAILLRQSTGVRRDAAGRVDLLAVRNVAAEQCDIEGPSTDNSDSGTHRIEWRVERAATPAQAEIAAQAWNRPARLIAVGIGNGIGNGLPAEASLMRIEGPGVISALKPADRGDGVIVRALLMPGPVSVVPGPLLAGRAATLADSSERDLSALPSLSLRQETAGALQTIRLR